MKKYKNFKINIHIMLSLLVTVMMLYSCEESFLEEKPDKALVVPTTLKDLQALIYNDIDIMNQDPAIGQLATDDVYTTAEGLEGASVLEANTYLWAADPYDGDFLFDWNLGYEQVFYANVVLDQLAEITVDQSNRIEWEKVKGGALFYRANAFFNLTGLFTLPYIAAEAESALGIPLRLEADVNKQSVRSSLKQSYEQILTDLSEAASLLPPIADFKTQPSKASVFALKSRVYLAMQDYIKAGAYADSSLQLHNALLDYNEIDSTKRAPFPLMNEEVLFHSTIVFSSFLSSGLTFVAPGLYETYGQNDLRRTLYFTDKGNGGMNFRGSYNGNIVLFSGVATDELYLTRAECRARNGDITGAMDDLNTLLATRWKSGTFVPFTASSQEEALAIILEERRKELVFRGLRWMDLRRLNQEPAFAKTLTREVNGKEYTLPPGDLRWAFLIPDEEIESSGIAQNPR